MTLDRRQFLRTAGVATLGAAVAVVLPSCTEDSGGPEPGETTTTQPTSSSSGAAPSDVALLKTAASLEALAVAMYTRVASTNLVQDPTAAEAIGLFRSHHAAHADALNALLTAEEIPTVTRPNDVVADVFEPAAAAASTQADLERMLLTLEDAIAQTYVYAAGVASKPEYRVAMMTIGGVQARHRALLGSSFADLTIEEMFPSAFARSDNPLPPDAIIS